MPRVAAARAAIQRREYSEIFLTLFMFVLRAEELWTPEPSTVKIYAGSFPLATPDPLNDAVERVAMFQRGSQELISPGKAGFGTAPLIRYSRETRYRLPNHNVDNDHQDGRMGIHRSGGQSGKHKYQSASRAK
jgi:hypothetical protein